MYGEWPEYDIDHKNRIKTDNRIVNLRLATRSQNQQNKDIMKSNTTGFRGVSKRKRVKTFQAAIRYQGELIRLGSFATAEEAYEARKIKELELFGEFANIQTRKTESYNEQDT